MYAYIFPWVDGNRYAYRQGNQGRTSLHRRWDSVAVTEVGIANLTTIPWFSTTSHNTATPTTHVKLELVAIW